MITGPAIVAIGCGLLYTVKLSDSKSYPMGYSALIGVGGGLVLQNVIVCRHFPPRVHSVSAYRSLYSQVSAQYEFHKEPKYVVVGTGAVTL